MSSRRVCIIVAVVLVSAMGRPSDAANARNRRGRVHPTTSLAQPSAEEQSCLATFRSAEMHVQVGELRAAKQQLLNCAQSVCGRFLRRQCATRYTELEPEVPSVVPLVKDRSGMVRPDVTVAVDGEAAGLPADGRAIFVDPGLHKFTFSAGGAVVARETAMILPGQRNRLVRVALKNGGGSNVAVASPEPERKRLKLAFADDAPDAEAAAVPANVVSKWVDGRPVGKAPSGQSRTLAFVLSGGGLAAVGAGALLTYWGRADNERLLACSPGCSSGAVSHVHNLYVGADIAFGVGAVALAGATWAYFRGGSPKRQSGRDLALRADVHPVNSGAVAGVGGTF